MSDDLVQKLFLSLQTGGDLESSPGAAEAREFLSAFQAASSESARLELLRSKNGSVRARLHHLQVFMNAKRNDATASH